jgi:cardiolipin synthase
LEQNFEVNALIYSKEETISMKSQFSSFQKNSKQLTLEEHSARPQIDRVKEKLARLSSPLM